MKANPLVLYPTQLALGLLEVTTKAGELRKMSGDDQHDYLKANAAPVVIGPQGRLYVYDHHHLARACWEAGIEELYVTVSEDLSHCGSKEFWDVLASKNWCHLYDQFGNGPHPTANLPDSVRGLGDDPFRSLAWLARKSGAYAKSDAPFAEFQWANFFRANLDTHPVVDDFDGATKEALALAKDPSAQGLPGYLGS